MEGEQGYLIIVTQTVITVEWKRRVKEENMMIKNLPTSSSSWVKVNRGDKKSHPNIFDDGDLNRIPRVVLERYQSAY